MHATLDLAHGQSPTIRFENISTSEGRGSFSDVWWLDAFCNRRPFFQDMLAPSGVARGQSPTILFENVYISEGRDSLTDAC